MSNFAEPVSENLNRLNLKIKAYSSLVLRHEDNTSSYVSGALLLNDIYKDVVMFVRDTVADLEADCMFGALRVVTNLMKLLKIMVDNPKDLDLRRTVEGFWQELVSVFYADVSCDSDYSEGEPEPEGEEQLDMPVLKRARTQTVIDLTGDDDIKMEEETVDVEQLSPARL